LWDKEVLMARRRRRRSAARTAIDITRIGVTTMVGGITVGTLAGAAPAGARMPTGPIYAGLGLMPVAGITMAGGAVIDPLRSLKPKRRRR